MTVFAADPSMGLVIGMGLGTVFIGLIAIIIICYLMGAVIRLFESKKPQEQPTARPTAQPTPEPAGADAAENRGELIAVISAVIAEQLGESAEAIRIKSIRRVS